jgi:xanthine dehydrogenase accessory factor
MHLSLIGNRTLLALVRELEDRGEPYAVATVVSRRPPVSSHLGDKAVIRADGTLVGWIGGSCSQPVVRREAQDAMREGKPRLVRLAVEADTASASEPGVTRVPMACPSGGEVEIFIEPHVRRPVVVGIGETPVIRALAEMAPVVGFDAQVVDSPERLAQLDPAMIGPSAFVVVASAGHYDEDGVAAALRSRAGYIALVASRRRADAVRTYLREAGVTEADLARLRNPAGLDIHAGTQEEIALSILAEIVQEFRTRSGPAVEADALPAARPALARDPVCGMLVEIAGARHTYEYEGQIYHFCCPHCRAAFVKEPAAHLNPDALPVS